MSDVSPQVVLKLGTRGSLLARRQSQMVAEALMERHPALVVEMVVCKTSGDRIRKPLHDIGGKGLFTKELEEALLSGAIDFAVHSYKDVPVTMPLVDTSELLVTAVPAREDVRDVLGCALATNINDLPEGARVGTGSLRRRSQLLSIRPDLQVAHIRGNIDTRLRKLRDGQFDAIILAMAGVRRGGLFGVAHLTPIPLEQLLPAAGQGALALQCRRSNRRCIELLSVLDDPVTHACVDVERRVVAELKGDCHSPIAALATVKEKTMRLQVAIGARDGDPPLITANVNVPHDAPDDALRAVMHELHEKGAMQLLHGAPPTESMR
jgi:hydroxymethylbilane synthase